MKRVLNVIENELTQKQREVITDYYFNEKTIPQIALERGIHKSSVCRCLQRAEAQLRKRLKY